MSISKLTNNILFKNDYYPNMSIKEVNDNVTKLGTLKVDNSIKANHIALKYVLIDQINYLHDVKQMTLTDIHMKVISQIDKLVDRGICTASMYDDVKKYIDYKSVIVNPVLKFHKAITLEILSEIEEETLPEEVAGDVVSNQECSKTMSIESLNNISDKSKLIIRNLGGSLYYSQLMKSHANLDEDFVKERNIK